MSNTEPNIDVTDFKPSAIEEVFDPRTPAEIEKELILQEEKAALDRVSKMKPDELASAFFKSLYPIFRDKLNGLNAKQAKYVLDAIVQYPLENDKISFEKKVAEEVFVLGQELLNAKYILTQSVQLNKELKAQEAAQAFAQQQAETTESKISVDNPVEMDDTNNIEHDNKVSEILNNVETTFTHSEK